MSARGSYAKGAATREQILDVAIETFVRNGYDKTSFREIARESGLSQAGLLHHFSSKQELLVAVLRRRDRRDQDRYDAITDRRHTAEGLIAAVRHNAEEPGLVRLFVAMSADCIDEESPSAEFLADRYRSIIGDVADDIGRRQADGEVSKQLDAETVASLLVAAADGLQLQWLTSDAGDIDMGERLGLLWSLLRTLP
ncbi:TetR/AcrR family transcriptional regulator [Nocardioides sp. CER19]|uniref:TetR/AcrR family transcriptional regulator n=1 Tax=Nocardioides sp. CER19 TaxID=3038538 RepID=UPI002448D204|nr:TetR/AcrR family transcriptional regulator [Nocardioides sp. CER19]MDH2416220.1 TetR/AcrR family transcriptional regulator [Nocardioides sp. CER19]